MLHKNNTVNNNKMILGIMSGLILHLGLLLMLLSVESVLILRETVSWNAFRIVNAVLPVITGFFGCTVAGAILTQNKIIGHVGVIVASFLLRGILCLFVFDRSLAGVVLYTVPELAGCGLSTLRGITKNGNRQMRIKKIKKRYL